MISDKISYAIVLNSNLNCLQRKSNIPMRKSNKNEELNYIMCHITGAYENMDLSKWIYEKDIGYLSYIHYDEDQSCICSQPDCRDMYFLRHISTGTLVRLGSQCILKYRPEDAKMLDRIKKESRKDDCRIDGCSNKLKDGRRWWCQCGYCSEECFELGRQEKQREQRERKRMELEDIASETMEREANYPNCYCNIKAIRKQGKKEGRYKDKWFWTCRQNKYDKEEERYLGGCNYFYPFGDEYEVMIT